MVSQYHHSIWYSNRVLFLYSAPNSNKIPQVPAPNPVSHGFYIYGKQKLKQHIVLIILHPPNPLPFEPVEIQPKSRLPIMKTSPLLTIPKIQSSTWSIANIIRIHSFSQEMVSQPPTSALTLQSPGCKPPFPLSPQDLSVKSVCPWLTVQALTS